MMPSVAITGGAGFIGSHLVDYINDRVLGSIPLVVDDLSRGSLDNLPKGTYTAYGKEFTRNMYRHRNIDLTRDILCLDGVSVLFHLAAKVTGIQYNLRHNLDMLHSNLAINWNVAEGIWCHHKDLERVIWVSTACVYPHDAPIPTPEDGTADVCDPEPTNRGYGIAKWVGEQQAMYLWRELHVPITIVRFFNAFGPRDYYDPETSHVAPALIKRVMDGADELIVWGTGTQTRALVDARDIARALVEIADCDRSIGQVVNIGHDREISIEDLAWMIVDIAYKYGYIEHKPGLSFDMSYPDGYARRAADTTKLQKFIGWIPDTPIEKTIKDMLQDYSDRRCERCNRHPCVCHDRPCCGMVV